MDQVQLYIFVVLAFTCLTHLVTPIPMVIDGELDYDTNIPVTEDIFELKDKKDLYDPTSLLMTRFRRNTAQWVAGSHHFNDHNQGSNRRFAHRRFGSRSTGGGQLVDA